MLFSIEACPPPTGEMGRGFFFFFFLGSVVFFEAKTSLLLTLLLTLTHDLFFV